MKSQYYNVGETFLFANGMITVIRETDDWQAQITGHPELWDCGMTIYEAIGKLVVTHSDKFSASMEHLLESQDSAH